MKNKRAFEMSFGWLFALIVGAFILFFAIFLTTRIGQVSEYEIDTTTAARIGVLLNPIETSFASGISTYMILPSETRIFNECELESESNSEDKFGIQRISLSQLSRGKWSEPGGRVGFNNKYIFSTGIVQGKRFELFSKPFEFPFKVANVIYMTSSEKNYCFRNPPEDIEIEINSLQQKNLGANNCTFASSEANETVNVCFGGGGSNARGCDINVYYKEGGFGELSEGYVEKSAGSEKVFFVGDALMYGAVFADNEIYSCQTSRLMKRLNILTEIYIDKSKFLAGKQCTSGLEGELTILANSALEYKSDVDLISMKSFVEDLDEKNFEVECKLW